MQTLTVSELYLAFRQAKCALFFEKRGVGLKDLASFEESLPRNLLILNDKLENGSGWFDGIDPGQFWVVPKKLRFGEDVEDGAVHIGPDSHQSSLHGLEVQTRLSPNPEFAIVEVLYLWKFGAILDSLLSNECVVGYRLDTKNDEINMSRRWLFQYWPRSYREFREAPIAAAQDHLKSDTDTCVSIISADLASFYETIDPSFMMAPEFLERVQNSLRYRLFAFDIEEFKVATSSLLAAYRVIQQKAAHTLGLSISIGIPIGSLTSRLVANLSLLTLDEHIMNLPDLCCYRRYVDDLAIVLNCEEQRVDIAEQMRLVFPISNASEGIYNLDPHALKRTGSEFSLQKQKVRVHHLSGIQGEDFLESVASDFAQVVSESRTFLDPEVLDADGARTFIRSSSESGSPLRVFRDADRTKLEHLALSTSLRTLERISSLAARDEALKVVQRVVDPLG